MLFDIIIESNEDHEVGKDATLHTIFHIVICKQGRHLSQA